MDISYVGRADDMVKVRGFRVELGEVDFALHFAADRGVQSAAAVVVESGETGADNTHIVGFVSPANMDVSVIREKLVMILPAYSRPSFIFAIPELPTTANSKIDRSKLADMAASAISHFKSNKKIDKDEDLSSTEKIVAKTWKELLGLRGDRHLGRDDHFLDLGGNSILALRAAQKIGSALLRSVPVSLVTRESNLGRLAEAIDNYVMLASHSGSLNNESFSRFLAHSPFLWTSPSNLSLSYLESDLFYSYACSNVKSIFSTAAQFTIYGPVKKDLLSKAFTSLVQKHPMLRARYLDTIGYPRRFIAGYFTPPELYTGDEMSARKKVQELVDTPFDLAKDQLFRALIWEKPTPSPETEITMVTHHIITDKESLGLMLRWASAKYESLLIERLQPRRNDVRPSSRVAPGSLRKPGTYIDWAEWLHKRVQYPSEEKIRRIQFWKQHLQGSQPISQQLHDSSLSGLMGRAGSTVSFYMPPVAHDSDTTTLKKHKYSQRLAVAATALTLHTLFGTRDVVLGIPYLNREEPETANMLGFFVERLPIRILLNNDNISSTTQLLDAVSDEIQSCIDHRLSYHDIIQATTGKPPLSQERKDDIVDFMLVYHWESDSLAHSLSLGPDVKVAESIPKVRPTGALFPLEVEFHEDKEGGVFVDLTYSNDIVCDECAYAFRDVFIPAMNAMARGVETTPFFFARDFL
jgi:gliotoxin/aspirochlorine biosynthesis peptide synthetase